MQAGAQPMQAARARLACAAARPMVHPRPHALLTLPPLHPASQISDWAPDYTGSCGRCYEVACSPEGLKDGYGAYFGAPRGCMHLRACRAPHASCTSGTHPQDPTPLTVARRCRLRHAPSDRYSVCRDPDASVVVQITDTCPCNYPSNYVRAGRGGTRAESPADCVPAVCAPRCGAQAGCMRITHASLHPTPWSRDPQYSNKRWCCNDRYHFDLSVWAFERLADPKWGMIALKYRECRRDRGGGVGRRWPRAPEPATRLLKRMRLRKRRRYAGRHAGGQACCCVSLICPTRAHYAAPCPAQAP